MKPGLGVFERGADAGLDVVTAERAIITWVAYEASRNSKLVRAFVMNVFSLGHNISVEML